jgi:hypothetical protein
MYELLGRMVLFHAFFWIGCALLNRTYEILKKKILTKKIELPYLCNMSFFCFVINI